MIRDLNIESASFIIFNSSWFSSIVFSLRSFLSVQCLRIHLIFIYFIPTFCFLRIFAFSLFYLASFYIFSVRQKKTMCFYHNIFVFLIDSNQLETAGAAFSICICCVSMRCFWSMIVKYIVLMKVLIRYGITNSVIFFCWFSLVLFHSIVWL